MCLSKNVEIYQKNEQQLRQELMQLKELVLNIERQRVEYQTKSEMRETELSAMKEENQRLREMLQKPKPMSPSKSSQDIRMDHQLDSPDMKKAPVFQGFKVEAPPKEATVGNEQLEQMPDTMSIMKQARASMGGPGKGPYQSQPNPHGPPPQQQQTFSPEP